GEHVHSVAFIILLSLFLFFFFFFNDPATTEIYTLSLHDALPIFTELEIESGGTGLVLRKSVGPVAPLVSASTSAAEMAPPVNGGDRKSTRLNSSHDQISYAVFCLKKKKKKKNLE